MLNTLVLPYSLILLLIQTLGLVRRIVAKGKEKAALKPLALVTRLGSKDSTLVDLQPTQDRSTKSVIELSEEELVSSKQLQALHKRVAKQEEYTTLL